MCKVLNSLLVWHKAVYLSFRSFTSSDCISLSNIHSNVFICYIQETYYNYLFQINLFRNIKSLEYWNKIAAFLSVKLIFGKINKNVSKINTFEKFIIFNFFFSFSHFYVLLENLNTKYVSTTFYTLKISCSFTRVF